LSLQSERYGYRPVPKYLPKAIFEEAMRDVDDDTRALARQWYTLDHNSVPLMYSLKNLTYKGDSSFWDDALPALR
jgi:hypothetical protein